MLTNRYLTALWLKEQQRDATVKELNTLALLFSEILGRGTNTYRHAKIELELGDCMIALKKKTEARDLFEKAAALIVELFGPSHGVN